MKQLFLIILSFTFVTGINAQKYMTKNGYVGFYSHTPVEDIKADNNQAVGVIDLSTGEMVFQVLIKSFHFDRALMEEHFNENYLESDKYPKSTFKGKIMSPSPSDFTKDGTYDISAEGDMTIHNVTRKISVKGKLEIKKGEINGNSVFNLIPEDYNIIIPSVVREKIDKSLEVTVKMTFTPLANK